jgi:Amt family ammonium transporter
MEINGANTAWVLTAAALVAFMTPGLALFYGGMVRSKNVLAMLLQNIWALGIISVIWAVVGFSLAFGGTNPVVGNLDFAFLGNLTGAGDAIPGIADFLTVPNLAFVAYQMMFAVITPALITGATADRLKFGAYTVFIAVWSVVVYSTVAHWVFSPEGWLFRLGALDFAGGAVVHINAGAAALGLVILLGPRRGWPREAMLPHSLPLTLIGTGILWFGWFGFNAGSALAADGLAAQALINTHLAAAAAMCAWLLVEKLKTGHATTLGGASGAVAGLVAITPCAGFVSSMSSLAIGAAAGVLCYLALRVKFWAKLDDSLDVLAVHLVGGLVGSLLLGLFASSTVNPAAPDGLLLGGGFGLLGNQLVASGAVLVFSLVASLAIGKLIDLTIGLRVTPEAETMGLDRTLHAESAYITSEA